VAFRKFRRRAIRIQSVARGVAARGMFRRLRHAVIVLQAGADYINYYHVWTYNPRFYSLEAPGRGGALPRGFMSIYGNNH